MRAATSGGDLLEAMLPESLALGAGPAGIDSRLAPAPDAPAVFLVHLRDGAPYLSRTRLLRRRLRRLLGEPGPRSRRLNLRGLATQVDFWLVGSRLASSLVSYELARRYFPETYVSYLKLRFPPYLKVILSNAFPRTQITTRLSGVRSLHYGPFRNRAAAEQFQNQVLDLFQVRRCQEDLSPSPDHPGCIYGEMNLCLRPCQAVVSGSEYAAEVSRLVEFLSTGGRSLAEVAAAARDRLSEEMNFEEAARQHKRLEKIQQVLRLRDDLSDDVRRLCGVAVTAAADARAAELWFFCQGGWQRPLRVDFAPADGRPVSLDHRLRELTGGLGPRTVSPAARADQLALLARWYYSSWREGEWIRLDSLDRLPYRKLVGAVARMAAGSRPRQAEGLSHGPTASPPWPSRPSTPPEAA